MSRSIWRVAVRGASLTLLLAGALLGGISCRDDDVAGPAETSGPMGSAAALSTGATTTQALSFLQVSAGSGAHTCGVTTDNRAYCWGYNGAGQLGDATFTERLRPVAVLGGLQFRVVSIGNSHTCGVTTDNRGYCWGYNGGRLGDGTAGGRQRPVLVIGGLGFRQVIAGMFHTCGLTTTNRVYCWGENAYGQLGDGTTITRLRPVAVSGGRSFRQVSAGAVHTCGVTTSYRVFCWGLNREGQLGDGSTVLKRLKPVAVAGTLTFRQLSAGYNHTCAVSTGNRAFCWGSGDVGQIGDGATYQRRQPRAVTGGLSFERVSAGHMHTCGETTDNRGHCWGLNELGELGDGTNDNVRLTPVPIAGGLRFNQLSAGVLHTCGKTPDAVAYCWGSNSHGQLGDGTTTDHSTPMPVADPM